MKKESLWIKSEIDLIHVPGLVFQSKATELAMVVAIMIVI